MFSELLLAFLLASAGLSQSSNDTLALLQGIDHLILRHSRPRLKQYQFIKIAASILEVSSEPFQLLSSSNVFDTDGSSYPAVLRAGKTLYSLRGQRIFGTEDAPYFFCSSVRNEPTYVAHSHNGKDFSVSKISFSSKTPSIHHEVTVKIPTQNFGNVQDFSTAFSLSQQLFAFVTTKAYIVFMHSNAELHSNISLPFGREPQRLHILRANTNLLVYSEQAIFLIASSGKKSTMRECSIPCGVHDFRIKYDDNNWKKFYLHYESQVYAYEYDDKRCMLSLWYQLPSPAYRVHVAATMLVLEDPAHQHLYYNMSNNVASQFVLPLLPCLSEDRQMEVVPRSMGSHILCDICVEKREGRSHYSCYVLEGVAESLESRMEKNDLSKFRIPIVFVSLCIVIYLSVSRKKAQSQGKHLEMEGMLGGEDRRPLDKTA